MNHGRTVFAQLVELLPRKAFDLAVRRYDGQHRVRTLSCMDQLLCMIFAQLTARAMLRDLIRDIMIDLTDREQEILKMRFGIEDGVTHTLEEVGKAFGVTRERIRQIEAKALEKMREHGKAQALEGFENIL